MRVTESNDHITNAVITSNEVINMGLSDNAEFMHMLSATLYSDQILAVVREVVCNAWDAHIDAGITDTPVEITLDSNVLSIKDFGKGICHEDMGPIYGIYGASTKLKKADNTGGFGLGCKAPFAYTDNFEVVSCHEGTKTIYRITKASTLSDGKPAIIPIASFKTQDTGLTVKIDIDPKDYMKFKEKLQLVLNNGQILAKINGDLHENILDFTQCHEGFLLTSHEVGEALTPMFVKYGSVIYPIPRTEEIANLYDKIVKTNYTCSSTTYRLILLAEPDSISVTPSRESLSMQEYTINTLNELMAKFLKRREQEFPRLCKKVASELTEQAIENGMIDELLRYEDKIPNKEDSPTNITSMEDMARQFVLFNYPISSRFYCWDMVNRLRMLSDKGLVDRGLAQTLVREYNKSKSKLSKGLFTYSSPYNRPRNSWIIRQLMKPIYRHPDIDMGSLFIFDKDANNYMGEMLQPYSEYPKRTRERLHNLGIFLLKRVAICSNKSDVIDRVLQCPDLNRSRKFLFYQVSRKKGAYEEAEAAFKEMGYTVYNFNELTAHIKKRKNKPTVKRPIGLAPFSSLKDINNKIRLINYLDTTERNADPEFIYTITRSQAGGSARLGFYSSDSTRFIVENFGDKGGIATSAIQYQRYEKKGAVSMEYFLKEHIVEAFEKNPKMYGLYSNSPEKLYDYVKAVHFNYMFLAQNMLPVLYDSSDLRKIFGIKYEPTDYEAGLLKLIGELNIYGYSGTHEGYKKLLKKLAKIKTSNRNKTAFKKLLGNPLIRHINFETIHSLVSNKRDGYEEVIKQLHKLLSDED